ncbi:MAG: imidazolonepropionase [Proteobacteria bacterium]|nr:imidazolonepropionase [Pseudomonadota bacterium]
MMNGNIFIKNASQLITVSGFLPKRGQEMRHIGVIENGAVIVENGIITGVGKTSDLIGNAFSDQFEIVDAANKIVLPGFIDSHTHFVFGGYRPDEFLLRTQGASYMEIMKKGGGIKNTVMATRQASREELAETALMRLNAMLSFGVTAIEGKSGYGLDKETEIKQLEVMKSVNESHPIDISATFLGAHAVPSPYQSKEDAYLDFLLNEVMPDVHAKGLAEFCDIFCEKDVFSIRQSERFLRKAKEMGFKLKIHADEIASQGGAELAASLEAISADHLLSSSDKGISDLSQKGVVATLLPGTAFCLKERYARARLMIDNDCIVALATDLNPGSCYTHSIPLMMSLAVIYMGMTVEEAITAFTLNGAAAINKNHMTGSIDVGKTGDLVVIDYPTYQFIPYHTGINRVLLTIKRGNIVCRNPRETCYPS